MAVRKFEFTVKEDGITPATEQRAGIQSEHGATQLVFNIDDKLYAKLLTEKGENSLVYRFDCYDSVGGTVRSDTKTLESSVVSFDIGENLTRHGGKAAVYLIISVYNSDDKTELELLSYPAKLRFENIPPAGSDNGEERESLSTLAEVAKNSAESAAASASAAKTAQGKTEVAQRALESGSEFFFNGGNSSGHAKVELVVDSELSETSENPIENKAVALKLEELSTLISTAVTAAIAEKNERDHPVGSFFASTENVDPATLYGGTWERIKGAFIWGIDDDETAGVTGGEKTHTLTESELPKIDGRIATAVVGEHGANGVTGHAYGTNFGSVTKPIVGAEGKAGDVQYGYGYKFGGGQAHNNMPPYYGAYAWRRTA
nr:MAG TPA: baseplate wedge protein [Caudoviricetes sp.]